MTDTSSSVIRNGNAGSNENSHANGFATVWIADPHPLLRSGLRVQLESSGFRVTGEGPTPRDAASEDGTAPQIVILDLEFGPGAVSEIKTRHPTTRIVVFAENAEISNLSRMFAAGADGYLLKSISPGALVESLRLALLGEKVFPGIVTGLLGALGETARKAEARPLRVGDIELSHRELGVVRGLASGQTNKCIARTLNLTEATVKVHIKTVLRKLGVANRTQVAIWAIQNDLSPSMGTSSHN